MRRMNELNTKNLLKEICDWYQHDVKFCKDGSVICVSECGEEFSFDNVVLALKDWLPTLEQSNLSNAENNRLNVWETEELDFIRSLSV